MIKPSTSFCDCNPNPNLQPRCQDLSLGFFPLEPQPKTEGRNPGKEVDILSTFSYYLDSYSLKCTPLDIRSVLITPTSVPLSLKVNLAFIPGYRFG